eukprot:4395061-Prymnesium_polylepis.1
MCIRDSNCTERLAVETAQHSSDIWMHRGLLNYANLTSDAAKADIIFVPFYASISHILGSCDGLDHEFRVKLLARTMETSPHFAKHGRRFVLSISHWAIAETMNSRLQQLVDASRMMLLVQDRFFFTKPDVPGLAKYTEWSVSGWACKAFDPCRTTIVPYPSIYEQLDSAVFPSEQERSKLVTFHGNTQLTHCVTGLIPLRVYFDPSYTLPLFCSVREHLVGNATETCPSPDLDVSAVDRTVSEGSLKGNTVVTQEVESFSVTATAKQLRESTFCLVPRGDTPTSRRLYDAIAAGCIPVVVADELQLPFIGELRRGATNGIDWQGFTLFYSESEVTRDVCAFFEQLRNVPAQRLQQLRANLWRARESFVYGHVQPQSSAVLPGGAIIRTLADVSAAIDGRVECRLCGDQEAVMEEEARASARELEVAREVEL